MHRAAPLLAVFTLTACFDAVSIRTVPVRVENPTILEFEGSGGALGYGLEVVAEGLEDGRELIVDPACQGRRCGEPAATEPGRCGVTPRNVGPVSSIVLNWDGRYHPRSHDAFGECLAPARVVEGRMVTYRLCGRLVGRQVRAAQLGCSETTRPVPDISFGAGITLVVPGADPSWFPVDAGPGDAGPDDGDGGSDGGNTLDAGMAPVDAGTPPP